MNALDKPSLRREIATSSYCDKSEHVTNDWEQFCFMMDQEKSNCDQMLTQLANECLALRLNTNLFVNSTQNPNLLIIDDIRKQCLISSVKVNDCIENIVYLSTRLSVLPAYSQYYRHCEQIVRKSRKYLERSQKRYDETMVVLTS